MAEFPLDEDKIVGALTQHAAVAAYVAEHAERGNPASVLATIDRYAREEHWLMNIGPDKGPLVQELAGRLPPGARILELGAYCGYSAIMFASTFGEDVAVTSIEPDAAAVACCRQNAEIAGLADRIEFIEAASSDALATLDAEPFDLVFLDHWKDLYKQDLQLIESRGLLKPGSIVVADNVGDVFNPTEYLAYVRGCGHYDCENREATIEYTAAPDAVEISVYRGQ